MRHFYLIWNPRKAGTEQMARTIETYLKDRGCFCTVRDGKAVADTPAEQESEDSEGGQPSHTALSQVPADVECVITLGGDGTLIRAARDLRGSGIPLIGVNMGNLGYLTQAGCRSDSEVKQMLDDLMAGQFQLEKRMMLKGSIYRRGKLAGEDLALNEILITRREMPKILEMKILVNGEPLTGYKADGMIIATPTGSTAYNLSAGGPIVAPAAQMMILTPICPHELAGRSIVFSAEDCIEIEILGHDDKAQAAVFDGDAAVSLRVGDKLKIERSQTETVLVKLKEVSFIDNLRSKLAGIQEVRA